MVLAAFTFLAVALSPVVPLCADPPRSRQPVVISGKVIDTQRRSIPAALISVPALNASTFSDSDGTYRLVVESKVRSGEEVVLRASREGFGYVSRSVRLAPGARVKVDFRLAPLR